MFDFRKYICMIPEKDIYFGKMPQAYYMLNRYDDFQIGEINPIEGKNIPNSDIYLLKHGHWVESCSYADAYAMNAMKHAINYAFDYIQANERSRAIITNDFLERINGYAKGSFGAKVPLNLDITSELDDIQNSEYIHPVQKSRLIFLELVYNNVFIEHNDYFSSLVMNVNMGANEYQPFYFVDNPVDFHDVSKLLATFKTTGDAMPILQEMDIITMNNNIYFTETINKQRKEDEEPNCI